jgi:hypothetical protein
MLQFLVRSKPPQAPFGPTGEWGGRIEEVRGPKQGVTLQIDLQRQLDI